jgi:HEAT repeat protein
MDDMRSGDRAVRLAAVREMGRVGNRSHMPPLRTVLGDRSAAVSLAATGSLAAIASRDPLAVDTLLQWLRAPEASVRWGAARALGELGPAAGNALVALLRATADTSGPVCWAAVEAAARVLRACGPSAIQPILQGLRDGNEEIIWGAAWILAKGGGEMPEAEPHLVGMEHHPNKSVRWAATQAMKAQRR